MVRLPAYIKNRKCIIVTDENVNRLYRDLFPVDEVVVIGTGEGMKTFGTVEMIYQKCLDLELDRSSFVLAIGGGIVTDIAGFAASTYLRGI